MKLTKDRVLCFVWDSPALTQLLRFVLRSFVPRGIYCDRCPFHQYHPDWMGGDGRPGVAGCAVLPLSVHDDSPVLWDGCKECGINDYEDECDMLDGK